jgi:hypothetical protein
MNSKATSVHPTNIKYRAMGTAYRSCKLSNVGSPKTATHRRKCGARDRFLHCCAVGALRFCQAKQHLN